MKRVFAILSLILLAYTASAQEVHKFEIPLFMPKGQWALGLQVTAVSMSANDSDFMLLLSGIDGSANLSRYAINGTFCYHKNQSVGARVSYTNLRGNLSSGNLDLLNDGLQFNLGNISASGQSFSAELFHRSYFGLDQRGRIGLFLEAAFGYSYTKTDAKLTSPIVNYSDKLHLCFAPGIEIFLLNNFSINFSIGLADISYNWCRSENNKKITGTRNAFDAKAKVSLSNMNFGLSFYF